MRTHVLRIIKLKKCHPGLTLVCGCGIYTIPIIKSKELVGVSHRHCTQRAFDTIRPNPDILIGVGFGKNIDRGRYEEEETIEGLHLYIKLLDGVIEILFRHFIYICTKPPGIQFSVGQPAWKRQKFSNGALRP